MAQFRLTAVSLVFHGRRIEAIMNLPLNNNGQPVLPMDICNTMLKSIGCEHAGQTYTVGG